MDANWLFTLSYLPDLETSQPWLVCEGHQEWLELGSSIPTAPTWSAGDVEVHGVGDAFKSHREKSPRAMVLEADARA